MPPYQLGKVYVVRNTVNDMVYVGSTTQALCARMAAHRSDALKKTHYKLYAAMNQLGFDKFYIELLVDVPCERKDQLLAREGEKIRELNTVAVGYNGNVAGRTQKQFYQDNKEAVLARMREYYAAHSEALAAQKREYYKNKVNMVRNVAYMRTRRAAMIDADKAVRNAKERARRAAKKAAAATTPAVATPNIPTGTSVLETPPAP